MSKYLVPLVYVGMGACITMSPLGQVPRTQLGFGEYKYLVGSGFMMVGVVFALLVYLKERKGQG